MRFLWPNVNTGTRVITRRFGWHSTIRRIGITVAVSWFVGYYPFEGGYGLLQTSSLGLSNAVVGGFSGGLVGSGGDIKARLQGAAAAALFYGAGSLSGELGWPDGGIGRASAHAIAGCVSSSASGRDCGAGAFSVGFAEGVGGNVNITDPAVNLVVRAAIGGAASEIGGGQFANGALTASFGYLFNCMGHPDSCGG